MRLAACALVSCNQQVRWLAQLRFTCAALGMGDRELGVCVWGGGHQALPVHALGYLRRALKGLALPRASHSSEIALAGSCRLRSTLAAAPVLFAHIPHARQHPSRPSEHCCRVLWRCVYPHIVSPRISMSTAARRRLVRDFKKMQTDPVSGVSAAPMDGNIMQWQAVIFG
jgi:hypothetical protein